MPEADFFTALGAALTGLALEEDLFELEEANLTSWLAISFIRARSADVFRSETFSPWGPLSMLRSHSSAIFTRGTLYRAMLLSFRSRRSLTRRAVAFLGTTVGLPFLEPALELELENPSEARTLFVEGSLIFIACVEILPSRTFLRASWNRRLARAAFLFGDMFELLELEPERGFLSASIFLIIASYFFQRALLAARS